MGWAAPSRRPPSRDLADVARTGSGERSLPNQRTVQGRQIPWLTFIAPGRITSLHQAHTSVGRSGPALIAFLFMIVRLDERKCATFKEKRGGFQRLRRILATQPPTCAALFELDKAAQGFPDAGTAAQSQQTITGRQTILAGTQQAVIEATTIPPSNGAVSAICRHWVWGNYTVILPGKNNTTSAAAVEVYGVR